jgi:hypothetical protein
LSGSNTSTIKAINNGTGGNSYGLEASGVVGINATGTQVGIRAEGVNGPAFQGKGSTYGANFTCTAASCTGMKATGTAYGAYGLNDNGNYGYLGGDSYGAYAANTNGNYAYLADSTYGVYGNATYGVKGEGPGLGGWFADTDTGSYAYLGYGAYGLFTGDTIYTSGDISASNNTVGTCSWEAAAATADTICSSDRFMAGVRKSAGVVTYIYCCEL